MACNCYVGTAVEDKDGNCTCINPTPISNEPLPKPLSLPPFQRGIDVCAGLQAPNGYKYIFNGQRCALVVNYDTDTRQPVQATQSATAAIDNAVASILPANLSTFYQNNKAIVLIGAGLLAWKMFSGKGMKPKSREVVATTRY